jgi:hypothetical protein
LNREVAELDAIDSSSAEGEQTGLEQEEEDEAEASPVDFVLPASRETQDGIECHTKSRSDRQTKIIWLEWFVVYHPTYRIPSLCFNASREGESYLRSITSLVGRFRLCRPRLTMPAIVIPLDQTARS